jgi:ribosomal protein L13E
MKYKTKYIKEKGQTGGVGKPCSDALKIHNITIATILREYDCDYDEIKKNFPNQLSQFNYDTIKSESITIRNLLEKKFPIKFLLESEFSISELKQAGVSIDDFIKENILILLILQHFTMEELSKHYAFIKEKLLFIMGKSRTFLIRNLGDYNINISIKEFLEKLNFTIKDLRDAGFNIKQIKDEGISDKDLKEAGFTASEMRELSYDAKKLRELGYTVDELIRAGFDATKLKDAGITFDNYISDKVSIITILEHFTIEELSLKPNKYLIEQMLKEYKSRIGLKFLIKLGIRELSNTFNFTNTDLINAGFDSEDFRAADISLNIGDLLDLKYNAKKFKQAGINISDIVKFVINPI